jgi:hypothetical protein
MCQQRWVALETMVQPCPHESDAWVGQYTDEDDMWVGLRVDKGDVDKQLMNTPMKTLFFAFHCVVHSYCIIYWRQ